MSGAIYVCTLSYVEEAEAAARRLRRGERQLYCGACRHWVWPEQCDHSDRLTTWEFNALVRRTAREVGKRYPTVEERLSREFKQAVKRGEIR